VRSRKAAALLAGTAIAVAAALCGAPAGAKPHKPEKASSLAARAILPADATAPAPFPALPNADPVPAPGSTQPVGGFSALLAAKGKDNYWAMIDNGFGNKANYRSFLLRVYKVHADWETAHGGSGAVRILDWITLHDPDHEIPFGIVNASTPDRLLSGGDFRHRVVPDHTPRGHLVRRRVRSLPPPHGLDRQGARSADSTP
jgi:glycerophosphoryl diester phosphodiesterase